MGLKLLVIAALLVCETISSDYFETDDDGTPDMTEGSGDYNIPDDLPTLAPRMIKCYRGRHSFNPNVTAEQLNAEPVLAGNKTSIPGGAAGHSFSPSILVLSFFIFVVSLF